MRNWLKGEYGQNAAIVASASRKAAFRRVASTSAASPASCARRVARSSLARSRIAFSM
jgi:hypothetical protein